MKRRPHHQRGQILLVVTMLFTAILMILVMGIVGPLLRQQQIGRDFFTTRQSYFAAEAGSEDAFYRVRNNTSISFPMTLTIGTAVATVSIAQTGPVDQEILSTGVANNLYRSTVKSITTSSAFNFTYALQSGLGGIVLNNNATIYGNIYSSGSITGSSNVVNGGVVSAGSSGLVDGIHATGTVYAHTIKNSTIDNDAYYQSFGGATGTVTVRGTKYPNSTDQPTTTMPITDALISQWETDAANGGNVTCTAGTYTVSTSMSLGPKKIPCNLVISGNGTVLTLTGTLWVTGTISVTGSGGSGVQVKVADSVGNKSVAIIADYPGFNSTSATITINGNSNFYGSTGNSSSYVMFVSQNNSAEGSGGTIAINVINGASGNILTYAPHGEIRLQNNVTLREVTAYKLSLYNNSVVLYQIGLLQSLITSGGGGAWTLKHWKESSNR